MSSPPLLPEKSPMRGREAAIYHLRMQAQDRTHRGSYKGRACHTFFEKQNLVEKVFLQLPMREILVNVQRVSKAWLSIVNKSDRLQQALFLKPVTKRPLTYTKLSKDAEIEMSIKKSDSNARLHLTGSNATPWHRELPFADSSSPPGTARIVQTDSFQDVANYSKRPKSAEELSSPTRLLHEMGRKHRKNAKIPIEGPPPTRKSSTSPSPASPRPSGDIPRHADNRDHRFYTKTERYDLRQQIFEHPLVSRHDAPARRYSIGVISGRREASWRRQLLTQPPVASVRVLGDKHAKKRDVRVYASDGIGVRLADVANALELRNLEFLAYEGKEWWRPCEWTKGQAVGVLQLMEGGIGDGPWNPVSGESKRAGVYF